jgi:hypothetical protein
MSRRRRAVLGWTIAALLAPAALSGACGSGESNPAPTVPWSDYAPELKARIDSEHTCDALQRDFDAADRNNASTMARTGHNNADLMTYIQWRLKKEGCPA